MRPPHISPNPRLTSGLPFHKESMKKILMSLIVFSSWNLLMAGLWPSGHVRLGFGVQPRSSQTGVEVDSMKIGQLSFDIQPTLLPFYLGLDAGGSLESDGQVDIPQGKGSLVSRTQDFTLSFKLYKSLKFLDVYAGLGATYLKTEQELKTATVVSNISEDGLGATVILGISDIQIFLPMVQWGMEFRATRANLDTFTELDSRRGAWLLTCGFGW
jgi:hypothetical protein